MHVPLDIAKYTVPSPARNLCFLNIPPHQPFCPRLSDEN